MSIRNPLPITLEILENCIKTLSGRDFYLASGSNSSVRTAPANAMKGAEQ
jgi:hypothetical protein